MLTPKQVSETLDIPPSTLRRYATRFESHLAPRKGKKRMYTVSDLDTFRKIRDLSASGYGLDRIDEMLDVVETPQDKSNALVTIADFAQSLEIAHGKMSQLLQRLDDQDDRIEALENWIMTPWYKRVGKRPPIE